VSDFLSCRRCAGPVSIQPGAAAPTAVLCDACGAELVARYRRGGEIGTGTLAETLHEYLRLFHAASYETIAPEMCEAARTIPDFDLDQQPAHAAFHRQESVIASALRKIGAPVLLQRPDQEGEGGFPFEVFFLDEDVVSFEGASDEDLVDQDDVVNALDFHPDGSPRTT
jgi:hypothetical protein